MCPHVKPNAWYTDNIIHIDGHVVRASSFGGTFLHLYVSNEPSHTQHDYVVKYDVVYSIILHNSTRDTHND